MKSHCRRCHTNRLYLSLSRRYISMDAVVSIKRAWIEQYGIKCVSMLWILSGAICARLHLSNRCLRFHKIIISTTASWLVYHITKSNKLFSNEIISSLSIWNQIVNFTPLFFFIYALDNWFRWNWLQQIVSIAVY